MPNSIAINNPITKRKTEELNKSHNTFSDHFIVKSRTIEIELAKEKKEHQKTDN